MSANIRSLASPPGPNPQQTSAPSENPSLSKTLSNAEIANFLKDTIKIGAIYGALDGLNLSYSSIKYYFDVMFNNSSVNVSDVMHDWMASRTGLEIAALTSISIVAFSFMASLFDEEKDKTVIKKEIATYWPYLRDCMKALKNAFKGFRTTLQALGLIGHMDLRYLMVPMGVAFGGLSMLNRMWYRAMKDERKDMQQALDKLYDELSTINNESFLENQQRYREELEKMHQSQSLRAKSFLSASFSGFVDGLYLFMGVLTLSAFSPQFFIFMTVLSSFLSIASIFTRTYEEIEFQYKLIAAHQKTQLAFYKNELDVTYKKLHEKYSQCAAVSTDAANFIVLCAELQLLKDELDDKAHLFTQGRTDLDKLRVLSNVAAFLAGLRMGLMLYGAMSTGLFLTSTVCAISGITFPPALIIACVVIGLAGIIAFPIYTVMTNQKNHPSEPSQSRTLDEMLQDSQPLKSSDIGGILEALKTQYPDQVKATNLLNKSIKTEAAKKSVVPDLLEVIRSFLSGAGKGQKAVDYVGNSYLVLDQSGHYNEPLAFLYFIVASALINSVVFGLRAYVKAFSDSKVKTASLDSHPQAASTGDEIDPGSALSSSVPNLSSGLSSDLPTHEESGLIALRQSLLPSNSSSDSDGNSTGSGDTVPELPGSSNLLRRATSAYSLSQHGLYGRFEKVRRNSDRGGGAFSAPAAPGVSHA